ncbi:MAG: three-Cys-motif partner protein TcmP [Desulfuromonadaceae bacterium]|nr:three-Cys-motif partner protein TcmP [Desulfuromonadaceae bacterium]
MKSKLYKGREQARFKHELLEAYLERLFMIVGQHQRTICYVDCFAGPWQAKGDDLEDTSIAVSLDIIQKCREGLLKFNHNVHFKALFVEKDPTAYTKLKNYLDGRDDEGVETHPLHGEFIQLREEILARCGNDSFTFFFVDPTGWKDAVELATLDPLLRRPNSEFLINFMYDFLVRTHTQEPFSDDMKRIFGKVPDTKGMTAKAREEHLVRLYRENLKTVVPTRGGKPRTACVQVKKVLLDRTLYHLVYLTRHPKGIAEFMAASDGLDLVQKRLRALAKQETQVESSGQMVLIAADESIKKEEGRADLSEVKSYWLTKLSSIPRHFGITELADMLEETDWFASDFQKAFKELDAEGKVKNLDAKKTRPVNAVNFEKGEMLVKLI